MKVKLYATIAVSSFLAFMTLNNKSFTNSAPAPAGYAGDPISNETCAKAGCHVTTVRNGNSVITIQIGTSPSILSPLSSSFTPAASTVYWINISLTGTAQKYGFSVSALNSSNQQAGSFAITNANGTSKSVANGIEYVSQNNASATKSWLFKWTSPATINGPITFYATAVLGSGDGTANSDEVYKTAASINGTSSAIHDLPSLTNLTVYPNPANENITLSYNLLSSEHVTAQIMNNEGKVVKTLVDENLNMGTIENTYNIAALAAGKYYVHINAAGKSSVKPLVKF